MKTEEITEEFPVGSDEPCETVCFVCTGNTCRSPMAEAVFNGIAKKEGLNIRALSAGLAADGISPISENAKIALRNAGIEFNAERVSRPIDAPTVAKCDKIVGITGSHAMALMMRYPQFAGKIFAMPTDIPDPYGGDLTVYTECLEAITSCIKQMLLQENDQN